MIVHYAGRLTRRPGRGGDLLDESFGPGNPHAGADPGFQRQAGLGAFGGLVQAAEACPALGDIRSSGLTRRS